MRAVEEALRRFGESDRPLVQVLARDGTTAQTLGYRQVTRSARRLAGRLDGSPRVGVVCANTPDFVVADLALLIARAVEVPVPLAFSREQAASLLEDVDVCLVDDAGARRLAEWQVLRPDCRVERVTLTEADPPPAPPGGGADGPPAPPDAEAGADWECKVIHTSGTTSRPKGVRIRAHGLDALLASLRSVMPPGAFTRYLSVVPFSLLIEQVTGLYLVLLDGGTLVLLPSDMPLVGTSAAAAADVMPYLTAARPTAMVATPALVDEFAAAAERARRQDRSVPGTLFGTAEAPLICCGGAPVHPDLLRRLESLGLPVHEGYGLSENSSVVSWNTPQARRIGTVGRPLPHVRVRLADDGELLVRSTSLFAGYTRDDPSSLVVTPDGWLRTGDLARIDEVGFISITGRKKNVIITAAGRNVAPEWVEAQYARLPAVRAVAVVGDGLAALNGLFLVDPEADLADAKEAIRVFGAEHLSEVERVAEAHVLPASEPTYQRFFTVTGRPMRAAVAAALSDGSLDDSKEHDHGVTG